MKNAGAVNSVTGCEMHVDQMLLSQCDESKVPRERNQIQGSNLSFFFLAVQLAHISAWTWSVRCTDSRSSSAPSCAANPRAPSHNQFCAVTLMQKSNLAKENKEEERWWNIPLSVSADSCRLSFAKTLKFCKHKWGRWECQAPIPSAQRQQNSATVGTLPLSGKLGLLVQSEEGPTSHVADQKQDRTAVATATRLTRLTKLTNRIRGTKKSRRHFLCACSVL